MILDTNAVSAWADGKEEFLRVLPANHRIALPVIVVGEYLWGLRKSRYREAFERWLAEAIRGSRVLPITLSTTTAYADVREILEAKGRPIPRNDAWIAALALEHGLPILSRDTGFDAVDGVERVRW